MKLGDHIEAEHVRLTLLHAGINIQQCFSHGSLAVDRVLDAKPVRHFMKHRVGEEGIEIDLRDNYVTFMASIFRSIRFGASSAHGRANMVRFNFFAERGAFIRDAETGRYKVDYDRMQDAMAALSELLLTLQGNGDYEGASELIATKGVISEELQNGLDRLTHANIPVDIVFNMGVAELGLD